MTSCPLCRFMKSSWTLALFVNVVLAGYFIVSGLGFGMWCVPNRRA